MKTLSIKQPWAWLIIHGGKNIENRKWRTSFRGRFLVHASKTPDKIAMQHFIDAGVVKAEDMVFGAVIGSVSLVGITTTGMVDGEVSKWFQGPLGFVLRHPEPLDFIHRCKGKLMFFEVNL